MSIHIEADRNQIAETVILPGDPLRAKFIAETFLDNPICYNNVRNMLGYTGTYKGHPISIQGSGMGLPSLSIYVHELIQDYGVKQIIRAGSCGALQPDIKLYDIVLAQTASTDSSMNRLAFNGMDFAPGADFTLLHTAFEVCRNKNIQPHVGGVFATDSFYHPIADTWKKWAQYGILAVEMESSALYTICLKARVRGLSILTVSDSLPSGEATSSSERETSFSRMAEICLETALSHYR